MWFRNLLVYRLTAPWTLTAGALEEALARRLLQPCTGLTAQSQGWLPVREDGALVYGQNRQLLFAQGVETKLLPASVIKDAAAEKAAQMETRLGFKPGRKALRELREQVTAELLPRAFARRRATRVWIDAQNAWLVVDSASPARGDDLTGLLRETLGELPVEPFSAAQSPGSAMTAWLAAGRAPGAFALDQDCELKSGGDDPAAVRFARHALEGDDVRRHLKEGKSVTRLGLAWNARLRFVLADDMTIRRLRFEAMEPDRESGNEERFDADFALMSGEIAALLADLVAALGGPAQLK